MKTDRAPGPGGRLGAGGEDRGGRVDRDDMVEHCGGAVVLTSEIGEWKDSTQKNCSE